MSTRIHPRRTVLAALLAGAFGTALAQQGPGPDPAAIAPEGQIDSVVVLGSARHDATVLSSSAPVDVITPQQLKETGACR